MSPAIRKTPARASWLLLARGTAVAQAVTVTSMPIVTRLYTPESIGKVSIYLSFFCFWHALLTFRYESALIVSEDEEESHHLFRLGAVLALLTALTAIPVFFVLQSTALLGFDALPLYAPFFAFISLFGYALSMLYRSWLLRLKEVHALSNACIARAGMNVGTRLSAGVLGFGIFGLLLAEVVGAWSAFAAMKRKTRQLLNFAAPRWSARNMKIVAIKYKVFPLFEMPSVLIDQLALALPVPIIAALYGPIAAGWFAFARLVYAIPNGQIGRAAGDVFQMEFGELIRRNKYQEGKRLFYTFAIRLFAIGFIPFWLTASLAPSLVPYILGVEWHKIGIIISIIAPWMFSVLVVSSMSRVLSVLQKQHWKLLYDVSSLFVIVSLYCIAKERGFDLIRFVKYLSFGSTLSYIFYFAVMALSLSSSKRPKKTLELS